MAVFCSVPFAGYFLGFGPSVSQRVRKIARGFSTLQQNYSGYNSKVFDDLMRRADKEPDAAKRGALLDQAQATLLKDLPIAPTFYLYERMLVKPYVQNFIENPRSIMRTRWLSLGPKPKK